MKFLVKIQGDLKPLLPKQNNRMGIFSSPIQNLKIEKMGELEFNNFRLLRDLKSITKNGGNIEFKDSSNNLVSLPEDVAVSVLNKSLKNGLVKKALTNEHVANVMQQISNLDEKIADKLLDKAASKERTNRNKFTSKLLLNMLVVVLGPIGVGATSKLSNVNKTTENWYKYRELKEIYTMSLLASDKDTTAIVETSNRSPNQGMPEQPRIKLQSENFGSFTHEIDYRDLQIFQEICESLQENKYKSSIDQLNREYEAYCKKHNIS